MSKKISVITATYNSANTISASIASMNKQNYSNVEHIIVDGGSSDTTLDIISDTSMRPVLVDSRPDQGIYDALNRGIRMASGDVIGFLHSDDEFATSEVLCDIAAVFSDDSVDACYSDLNYVNNLDERTVVRRWIAGDFSYKKLFMGWMPPHPTFYATSNLLKSEPFNLTYSISADYDQMLRILVRDDLNVRYLPGVAIQMALGGESNRSFVNIMRKLKQDYAVIRRNGIGGFITLCSKNLRKLNQFSS